MDSSNQQINEEPDQLLRNIEALNKNYETINKRLLRIENDLNINSRQNSRHYSKNNQINRQNNNRNSGQNHTKFWVQKPRVFRKSNNRDDYRKDHSNSYQSKDIDHFSHNRWRSPNQRSGPKSGHSYHQSYRQTQGFQYNNQRPMYWTQSNDFRPQNVSQASPPTYQMVSQTPNDTHFLGQTYPVVVRQF